jgi:transcriptional regulator with XRE-family HTH domain
MNTENGLIGKPGIPSRQAQINAWMALHGLSQVDLGKLMGITGAMVGMIIHGKKKPTPERLEQLTNLGFPVYLLPKHHNPEDSQNAGG